MGGHSATAAAAVQQTSPPPPPHTSAAADATPQQTPVVVEENESKHPWPSVFVTFGVGLAILVTMAFITIARRRRRVRQLSSGDGKIISGYTFVSGREDDIELQDLRKDAEEEDIRVLVKLGTGANAAFQLNREMSQ